MGANLSPAEVELRLGGHPDGATVASVIDALRSAPAWSVEERTLPGRSAVLELRHHPSGSTYRLRRRHGPERWTWLSHESGGPGRAAVGAQSPKKG